MIYTGLVKFIIIRSYITIKESTRGDLDDGYNVVMLKERQTHKSYYNS